MAFYTLYLYARKCEYGEKDQIDRRHYDSLETIDQLSIDSTKYYLLEVRQTTYEKVFVKKKKEWVETAVTCIIRRTRLNDMMLWSETERPIQEMQREIQRQEKESKFALLNALRQLGGGGFFHLVMFNLEEHSEYCSRFGVKS